MAAPTVDGLDIHGAYQPVADWDLIPQFVLMSVKGTEGASFVQPKAKAYFVEFRRRGFRYRGIYHWLRPDSSAQQQFDNLKQFVASVGGLQQGEFVQVDWERTEGLPMPPLALVVEFNRLCQQEWPGRVIVYVSDWVTNFHEWLATNPLEPLWYANYNVDPNNPAGGWQECAKYHAAVWQFTSAYMCPGITSRCDANHILDTAAMERLAGYPAAPPPTDHIDQGDTPPTTEDPMDFFTHSDNDHDGHAPRWTFWALMPDGTKRHVSGLELDTIRRVNRDAVPALSMADIDTIPDYAPPPASATLNVPVVFDFTGTATTK